MTDSYLLSTKKGRNGSMYVVFRCKTCDKPFRIRKCFADGMFKVGGAYPQYCSLTCSYISRSPEFKCKEVNHESM